MRYNRNLWTIVAGLAVAVTLAGLASAVTTPNAGGDQTVDEDVLTTYTGTEGSGTATSMGWEFDGNIVDGNPADWTFDTPGMFVVSFWADDGGGSNVSDTITVTVTDTTPPVADAGSDQTVDEDAVVTFDGSATTDNDPNFATTGRYYWTFTDGSTAYSFSGQVAGYTFATPGTYFVNLLVLDDAGNFAADSLAVTVGDVTAPVGSGTVPASEFEDVGVDLDSAAITDNDPNFASTRRDYWTFTDGGAQNLSGTSQSWTFATPGTYAITLTVMDAAGNTLTTIFSVTILDITNPTASWTISGGLTFNEDALKTLDASASTDNVGIVVYTWTIYDTGGSFTTQSGVTTTYTWTTPGTFLVVLVVDDAAGNTESLSTSVTVRDITAPTGAVSITGTINEDASTTLDATSVTDNDPNFAGVPNGRYFWTFTDAGARNLSGSSVSYTFNTPGSFVVTLLVMDNAGNRLTASGTITVLDVTAPTSLSISGGGISLERFRSTTMTGSASDNVGVAAYWWTFTDGSPQNVSGTTLSRQWSTTGPFTITFAARDSAWNIATTTTSITITPDVTAPTVTFTSAPTIGDNLVGLTYTATVSDLDPACAASCTWTWMQDGVVFSNAATSQVITWSPGRHSLSLLVSDPTGNTRNQTVSPIDIDQVVQVDTVQTGLNLTLNYNIRIQNGATLTWSNSQIWNASLTPPRTVVITVASGRFILDNSQMVSLSTFYGFRIIANGTGGAGSFVYINQSTITGLHWLQANPAVARAGISINGGTLSVRDSTLNNVRWDGTSATNPFAVLGTDANLYFNNVTLNATVNSTMGGIRADYTAVITVLQSREFIVDGMNGRSGRTVVQVAGFGVTGTINVTLLNSMFRVTNNVAPNRAIDFATFTSGSGAVTSGVFNYRLQGVDASNNAQGGLYGIHPALTGTVNYRITDSTFDGALSQNGMFMNFTNANGRYSFTMNNVSSQRAGQFGWQLRFESSGWMQGTIDMTAVQLSNQTAQSGWYIYQSGMRQTTFITMTDTKLNSNQQYGLRIDSLNPSNSVLRFTMTRCEIADNRAAGIYFSLQNGHYNMSFDLTDTNVVRNAGDNLYFADSSTTQASLNARGNFDINLTRSSFSNSIGGNGMQFYNYYYANQNITGRWVDSHLDNNRLNGIYYYVNYLQYGTIPQGNISAPNNNFTLWTDRTTLSRNQQDGIYFYDQQLYGYLSYTCNPVCGYLQYSTSSQKDLHLNDTHIDSNSRRGITWQTCTSYCYYSAALLRLYLEENSTVSDNAWSGIYSYLYYMYSYGWLGGTTVGPQESVAAVNIVNSSVSRNGLLGSDNYGIYTYFMGYYGMGPQDVIVRGSDISGNGGAAIATNHQYNYYSSSHDDVRVFDSNISNNGGRGIETYNSYVQQLSGGVNLVVNNTTFISNAAGAIQQTYPESYGRYQTPWNLIFTYNTVDQSTTTAIGRAVSTSCQGCGGQGGSEMFNISNNSFTNIQGAAVAWGFDPPAPSASIDVDISGNYVADVEDGITFGASGSMNTQHTWHILDNVIERSNGNGMLLSITNEGPGNTGDLIFERNTFRNNGGTAFTLIQDNIKLSTLNIKDCVFNTQRTGMQLSGIVGTVDHATFIGSVKEDIILTDGILEIHNTPVDPLKLKPVGNAAAFNVWFHLQVNVVWAGTGKAVIGAVVQMADSGSNTFFVGSIANDSGIPDRDLWSYTKSLQGVLGRTPFRIDVTYFEIEQIESIDLFQDRVVTVELRDNVLPTVVISNPSDGFGIGANEYDIQLDGSVFDSQSGFVFDINDPQLPSMYVEVSADQVNWDVAHVKSSSAFEVQFDYLFTALPETVHALYVRVHDDAGNYFTRVIPVLVDRSSPFINILEPTSPSITTNKNTVTLSAETEVGALIFVNGQVPPVTFVRPDGVTAYFTMQVPVFEGPNTITVASIDALNNQREASIFAQVDLQPPYLAVTAPNVDALTNNLTIMVKGQTERTGVSIVVKGSQDYDAPVDALGNFSVLVALGPEQNRLEILATDDAGNTFSVFRDVRVDTQAPWITIQSPANGSLLNSAEVDVVGIVEPGARLIVNDEVVAAATGAFSRRILLTEGANLIQFVAIDPAGNTGQRTVRVVVDSIEPVLTVTSPANESLVNANNVVVTGRIAEEHQGRLRYNGQDIQVQMNGTNATFSFVATLFEGTNFINLEATDGAGNTVTTVLTVVADTAAPWVLPEFEGTFLEGAQVKTYGASVTVMGYAEKGAELLVCAVPPGASIGADQVCNAIPLAADGRFQTFVELRADSLNTVNVTASDAAGNTLTRQMQVVQSPPPAAEIPPTPVGLYALYGIGIALLGTAFFLLFMRKGRGGEPSELAGADMMAYGQPGAEMPPPPPMGGELGSPSPEMTPAPEVAGDVQVTAAPELYPDAPSEPTEAPEGDVAAAPSRARPMRRKPGGGMEGAGDGAGLTAMGAEEEAVPGDIHQDEQKEG